MIQRRYSADFLLKFFDVGIAVENEAVHAKAIDGAAFARQARPGERKPEDGLGAGGAGALVEPLPTALSQGQDVVVGFSTIGREDRPVVVAASSSRSSAATDWLNLPRRSPSSIAWRMSAGPRWLAWASRIARAAVPIGIPSWLVTSPESRSWRWMTY